jgi:hypothetical protein
VLLFRPIEKVEKELQLFVPGLRFHASLLRKQQAQQLVDICGSVSKEKSSSGERVPNKQRKD